MTDNKYVRIKPYIFKPPYPNGRGNRFKPYKASVRP